MNIILKLFSIFIVGASSLSAMEGFPSQGSRKRTHDKSKQQETKKQKIEPQDITLICKDDQNNYHSIKTTKQIIDLSTTLSELYQEAQGESNNNPIQELDCASLHRHVHELVSIINLLTDMYHQRENKSYTYTQFQKAMKQPTNEDIVRWFNDFKQQIWSALKSEQDSEEFRKLIEQLDIPLISELLNCCIYEQKTGLPYILGFDVGAKIMKELINSDPKAHEYNFNLFPFCHRKLIEQLTDSNEEITYSPDLHKGAQIIKNPGLSLSYYSIRLLDLKNKSIKNVSLYKFSNSSIKEIHIHWHKSSQVLWVQQEGNAYIIYTTDKAPLFLADVSSIEFSEFLHYAIVEHTRFNSAKLFSLDKKDVITLDVKDCANLDADEKDIKFRCMALSANEQYIAVLPSLSTKVCIFDLKNNSQLIHTHELKNDLKIEPTDFLKIKDNNFKFSSQSDKLYILDSSILTIINFSENTILEYNVLENSLSKIQFSPDGNYFITLSNSLYSVNSTEKIAYGELIFSQYDNKNKWLPNHPHTISIRIDNKLALLDAKTENMTSIPVDLINIARISYSNTGRYIICKNMGANDSIIIWDLKNNTELLKINNTNTSLFLWSFDDKFLIRYLDFSYDLFNIMNIGIYNCESNNYINHTLQECGMLGKGSSVSLYAGNNSHIVSIDGRRKKYFYNLDYWNKFHICNEILLNNKFNSTVLLKNPSLYKTLLEIKLIEKQYSLPTPMDIEQITTQSLSAKIANYLLSCSIQ